MLHLKSSGISQNLPRPHHTKSLENEYDMDCETDVVSRDSSGVLEP